MYVGKTLFSQLMDFLPWTTFARIVDRYGGNQRVRTLPCSDQFRILAFAQLAYRASLRDIEACLSAQAAKLYHMGIRSPVKRSTLADANERRDWRIYADFAQRLMAQARTLYADEELGVDLSNTRSALDSTTIDLCLSVFPWALFRRTKAAVKLHTLLDLRGHIPRFIHVSDGTWHDVNVLDLLLPEPAAIYVMDRASVDFARLFHLHQAGAFFVTRAKSNATLQRLYSAPSNRAQGILCDQTVALSGGLQPQALSAPSATHPLQRSRIGEDPGLPDQPVWSPADHDLFAVPSPLAGRVVFQMDQTAPPNQDVLRHVRECSEDTNLGGHLGLCPRCHRQEATRPGCLSLHFAPDSLRHPVRENPVKQRLFRYQAHLS